MPARDPLFLQYHNGLRVNYDWPKIYGEFGRELTGYVRALDLLADAPLILQHHSVGP